MLIAISEQGYPSEKLGPWEPGEAPREVVVRLHPYPTVSGRVLAYGEPVEGARLSLGYVNPQFVTLRAGFPVRFLRRDGLATTDAKACTQGAGLQLAYQARLARTALAARTLAGGLARAAAPESACTVCTGRPAATS